MAINGINGTNGTNGNGMKGVVLESEASISFLLDARIQINYFFT